MPAVNASPINARINTAAPINEFTDNAEYFVHGFAHLFLLGEGVPDGQGSLTEKSMQHLMLQFDSRFARCVPMLFALFNQLQRHAACRHVAVRVKGGSTGVGKFVELANDANFRARLDSDRCTDVSRRARDCSNCDEVHW